MKQVLSVSDLNRFIHGLINNEPGLSDICVTGEISGCTYSQNKYGMYIYYTLKDENSIISCIMRPQYTSKMKFKLEKGMKVLVRGYIDVYEKNGVYQIFSNSIEKQGIGDIYARLEQLKQQYMSMGYFDPEYKRPIPYYCKRIGIVTSSTGAVIEDIRNVAQKNNPYAQLFLFHTNVQGKYAPDGIAHGIEVLNTYPLDVIIIGRGGGSVEDLMAFNNEKVIEAVFNSVIPVISAVGHGTDISVTDLVADAYAVTPTKAAEMAIRPVDEIIRRIDEYNLRLDNVMKNKIVQANLKTDNYLERLKLFNPEFMADKNTQKLTMMSQKLDDVMRTIVTSKIHMLELLAGRLAGVSPLEKLSQGYSFVQREDGSRITGTAELKKDDVIDVYMKDGYVKSRILEVNNGRITNT